MTYAMHRCVIWNRLPPLQLGISSLGWTDSYNDHSRHITAMLGLGDCTL